MCLGVNMEFLRGDVDLRLLFLTLVVSILFIGATVFYHNSLDKVQEEYDKKVARLEKLEEQLILQEEKLKELSKIRDSIKKDKENLEENYGSIKNEYDVLRLEKTALAEELDSKPFAKILCKASGSAECQN